MWGPEFRLDWVRRKPRDRLTNVQLGGSFTTRDINRWIVFNSSHNHSLLTSADLVGDPGVERSTVSAIRRSESSLPESFPARIAGSITWFRKDRGTLPTAPMLILLLLLRSRTK
jgi:hypothetical protein